MTRRGAVSQHLVVQFHAVVGLDGANVLAIPGFRYHVPVLHWS